MAKAMAQIMQCKFLELQCMGVTDTTIIKGCTTSYKGNGKPSLILRKLREIQIENPVFLIKNIDLVFKNPDYHTTVSSEVLQFLHPNQNKQFYDQFLQMNFDFSNILYVCTCSFAEAIPAALLPFVEVVQVSSFISTEKMAIMDRFLIPQLLEEFGTVDVQVEFKTGSAEALLENHGAEVGVNELRMTLDKIILRNIENKSTGKCLVRISDVEYFSSSTFLSLGSSPHVSIAFLTEKGGEPGFIEISTSTSKLDSEPKSNVEDGSGASFNIAGILYDVSQRMAASAFDFIRRAYLNKPHADTLKNANFVISLRSYLVHPNTLTPFRDDNTKMAINCYRSVGGAIAVGLRAVIQDNKLPQKVGVLVEITSTGQTLPLDHLGERVKALVRVGIKEVVVAEGNLKDVKAFPKYLTDIIKIHTVSNIEEAFLKLLA